MLETDTDRANIRDDDRIDAQSFPRISGSGISKRFVSRTVLHDVSIEVAASQSVALFGANGAGKTTLLRILATLSRPRSGELHIDGFSVQDDTQAIRSRLGVVAHQPYIYDSLSAAENLQFYARMYDVQSPDSRVAEVLDLVGLAKRKNDRAGTFSRGMQQRLSLARAILHHPTVLLLDEPDTGLDRDGIAVLERVIQQHTAAGGSAVMTTHNLQFGLENTDWTIILRSGRVAVSKSSRDLNITDIERAIGWIR